MLPLALCCRLKLLSGLVHSGDLSELTTSQSSNCASSRLYSSRMGSDAAVDSTPVRWGIIGCGRISGAFVSALTSVSAKTKAASVAACAARSLSSAQKFAAEHNIPKAYDSYQDLVADPEIDVVYIGTLHISHSEHAQLALNHGKHVVVEKPMAMNAREAEVTIALAREKGLFFFEAMWTRFFPAMQHVREVLAKGVIGEVQHVQADMGFAFEADNDRIWKRSMGGGALLDIGIYPLAFITFALGTSPTKITAVGRLSDDDEKVDVYANVTLEFPGRKFATMQYSAYTQLQEITTYHGTKGRITIGSPAHMPTKVEVTTYGKEFGQEETATTEFPLAEPAPGVTFVFPQVGGFTYEAEAATNAIKNKQVELPEYTPDESLGIQKIMDEIRKQLGLVYDADNKA